MHVMYYASRTLDEAHKNYATIENELLDVVFIIDKFSSYLMFYTNHIAIKYLIGKKNVNPRLIHWILLL